MAVKSGTSGVFKINLTGQSVAAVGSIKSFTMSEEGNSIDSTVMGQSRSFTAGIPTTTTTVEALWDEADTSQLLMDANAAVDFEIHPTGTASGETKFSASNGMITNRTITVPFDGMVEASFNIVSGAVTEAQNS